MGRFEYLFWTSKVSQTVGLLQQGPDARRPLLPKPPVLILQHTTCSRVGRFRIFFEFIWGSLRYDMGKYNFFGPETKESYPITRPYFQYIPGGKILKGLFFFKK